MTEIKNEIASLRKEVFEFRKEMLAFEHKITHSVNRMSKILTIRLGCMLIGSVFLVMQLMK